MPPPQQQPNTTQVVMDMLGLEETFRVVAIVIEKIGGQQVCTTETLNNSIREQQKKRENNKDMMEDLAKASHKNTFQHILASILYFDGTGDINVMNWLECIEAACLYARRDPCMEALGHCGGKVLDSILSILSNQPWAVLRTTLIQTYSEFKSAAGGPDSKSFLSPMLTCLKLCRRVTWSWLKTILQDHLTLSMLIPPKIWPSGVIRLN